MIFIYVPCQNLITAKIIAKLLVEKKMAGDVDIIPIQSIVRLDQGATEISRAVIIIKTIDKHVQNIEDIVRENYQNGVPCIAAITLNRINREFKEWLVGSIG